MPNKRPRHLDDADNVAASAATNALGKQEEVQIKPKTTTMGELIVSWNCANLGVEQVKWLKVWIDRDHPAIVCLNETRQSADQVKLALKPIAGYQLLINSHEPARWHGVAVLVRDDVPFELINVSLDCKARQDNRSGDPCRGRLIALSLPQLAGGIRLIATYSPNSGRGLKNVGYRVQEWDRALFACLEAQRSQGPTLWIGDVNVALDDVDVSHPGRMKTYAGFSAQERASFRAFLHKQKWIDAWRTKHPTTREYSWHGRGTTTKTGMRLDNAIVSDDLARHVVSTFIGCASFPQAPSDHQPISIRLQ
jgi:exodeoxyribonuclease-3